MYTISNACAHTQTVCEGCAARRRTRPGDTEAEDVEVTLRSYRVLSSFDGTETSAASVSRHKTHGVLVQQLPQSI